MDKEIVIHTHIQHTHGILFTLKKEGILPFPTTWMNLEDVTLKEISSERKIPHDLTYMWNPKQSNS